MSKAKTLLELTTKAHGMEMTIAKYYNQLFSPIKSKKDKVHFKKNFRCFHNKAKEAMSISISELLRITEEPTSKEKKGTSYKDTTKDIPFLENKYTFYD